MRHVVGIAVAFCLFQVGGMAQTVEFRIPLDLDDDPNTGCPVVTVDGTFLGAEQILITTVNQGSMLVTDVSIADCTGAVFGAPVSISPGGWPVGQGTGVAGSDVIETFYPMTVFNTPSGYVPVALTANEPGGDEDALLLNNGNPIRLLLFIPVPTLSQWALIAFVLLLMLAALVWMRRHPNQQGMAVLFLAVASLALLGFGSGIVLDGDPSDWTTAAIASDPAGDNNSAPDILAFYSCVQGTHPNAQSIYFRIDAVLNQAPSADPQMQTLLEDDPALTITLTGMDPEGQPLTFSIDSGPANGSLSAITPINATSASVDYTPNADYFGADSFDFMVNDGLANSIPATVTLDITPVNDAPLFTAGADVMVIKDIGPQTISAWATGIAAGPANESSQILTFNVTNNTNPGLFAASGAPAVDPLTGDLTFENEPDINGTAIITLELMDDGGIANGGMDTSAPQMFTIDIGAVNDPPNFTAGADPTVLEDAGAQTIAAWATALSPGPPDEAGQTLTFNVTGNTNPSLFLSGPAVDGTSGDLTFETALDANGSADITIELMDDGGTANGGMDTSAPQMFTINVTAVNDPPLFTVGMDETVLEDAGAQSVTPFLTAISPGPADEAGQTVSFMVSNDNNGLFTTQPDIDSSGNLTYETATDANGSAMVTVTAMDDGGVLNGGIDTSAPQMFNINVTAINDEPSFTPGSDQMVLEDAGPQSVAAWASAMSPGPPDEAGQMLTFSVTGNTNPGLFLTGPAVDGTTGNLTYETATDAVGDATITLLLMDDGGTANGGDDSSPTVDFMISVTAVNDPPSFMVGADESPLEDAGPQTVVSFLAAISPGPADEAGQTVSFMVSNDNNGLFTTQPAIDSSGNLSYETAMDAIGSAMVTVTAMDDGGVLNGGIDTSAPQMFTITVIAVNDEPSFVAGMNITFMGPPTAQTEMAWATMMSPGPADESGQMLTFNVTGNDNMGLFTVQPAVDAMTGDLTYTPAAAATGMATITLELMDNGGTANGGDDTSPAVMFTMDITAVNNPPVVVDEMFQTAGNRAIGNTTFEFANASAVTTPRVFVMGDVLANDTDGGDGPGPISVSAYDATSVAGAAVVMNGTGEFTYQPPLGMNPAGDTFTYTVTDGLDTTVGTVTVDVVDKVWFIDGDAAAGTGASNAPFNTIPAFMAEQGGGMMDDPEAGDRIFIHQAMSPYDAMTSGGITLLDGQILHGEGVDLIVDTATLHAVGGNPLAVNGPTIANTSMMNGDVVTVAMNNTVQGMVLQPLNSAGIGTGAMPMKDKQGVRLRERSKVAVSKVGNLILDYLSILPIGNSDGIYLSGRTGTATITNTTITGPGSGTGAALWIEVCNAITITATDLMSSGMGWGMDLYQNDNSVLQFLGTTTLNNSVQRGVALTSNDSGVDQSVNFTTLNITSTQGVAIEVTDHNGTLVVPAGTINHGGGRLCDFDNFNSGTDLSSLSISSTDHEGLSIDNSAGTFTFPAMTITTPPSVDAISLQNNVGATTNFGDLALTTNGTSAFFANNGGLVNLAAPNTATINTTDDMGIDVSGTMMSASFDSVIVNNSTGGGINLNNNTGTTDFGLLTITNTGGTGLTAMTAGTVNVTDNTSSIVSTNGPAVVINPTTVGMTFATVNSTNSPAMGISLTGVSGSLTMNGGSITGSAGTAFNVNGGNGSITYAGTVNNSAGNAVSVVSRTGGMIDMLGAITDTGAAGIVLNSNSSGNPVVNFSSTVDITNSTGAAVSASTNTGATISFADLDIDNSASNQEGLSVSATGTLNVSTGTIDGGSASAVDIDNTQLGVNLVRVDSDGGASPGIDLNTTTGSFTVTGDGGGMRNESGGVIQNKTGNGITLFNVVGVSLISLTIQDNDGSGLDAVDVDGFILDDSIVTNNMDLGGGFSGNQAGLHLHNLSGTCGLNNTEVSDSQEVNVYLVNDDTTLPMFTFDGCLIEITDNVIGSHGILIEGRGTGDLTVDVLNSTIQNNRSSGVAVNTADTSTMDINIVSNSFDTNNNSVDLGHNSSGTFDFTVTGTMGSPQTMLNGQGTSVINVNLGTLGGTMSGTVDGNSIGTHMVAGSGSTGGSGIRAVSNGGGTLNVNITNNMVRGMDAGDGINILARDGSNTLRAVIEGNDVRTLNGSASGIFVDNGALGTDTTTICLSALNNTAVGGGFFGDIEIENNHPSTVFQLERFVGNGASTADINAHLVAENTIGFAFSTINAAVMGVADDACNF